jgi:hypothetical protein
MKERHFSTLLFWFSQLLKQGRQFEKRVSIEPSLRQIPYGPKTGSA